MVKTPRTRHYKPKRSPVTIDLEATPDTESDTIEASTDVAKADEVSLDARPAENLGGVADDAELSPANETPQLLEATESDAGNRWAPPSSEGAEAIDDKPRFDDAPASAYAGTADTKTAAPATPDYAPPPPRRGVLSNLVAGLIGGIAALALAGVLQFAGVLGAPGARTAAPALDSVQAEIGALKSEIAGLKTAGGGDSSAAVAELTSSVDQLKVDLLGLQSAVQAGGAGDNSAAAALDGRVKELETRLAALPPADPNAANEALDTANGRIATLEQSLATLQQTLAALTGKVDAQAAQPKIALAISAAALKSALDRGSAFTAELETFAAISPNAPELAALRQYAEAGVMMRADIAKAFSDAASAMVAAAEPSDQNAGFFQRLLSSAESVVKVRPVGEVPGDAPAARVARMEVAVNAGDYDKALAEFAALPPEVQAAGAQLVDKIKARLAVEKLADQMIAGAMKA